MLIAIQPPTKLTATHFSKICLFLGGSIEMGSAEHWQKRIISNLEKHSTQIENDLVVFNSRRDDWDSSWEQKPENEVFYNQVTWELEAQEASDILIYYFDPYTKSPITLLELGRYSSLNNKKGKSVIVFCNEPFYRWGNVKIFCDRYGIDVITEENLFIDKIKSSIQKSLYYYNK